MGAPCVPVLDYSVRGWETPERGPERSRWCCEQLEAGRVLVFEFPPFDLPEADCQYLLEQQWEDSRVHKHISYRPSQDCVRGVPAKDAERVHSFMRRYSAEVLRFLGHLLAPYAPHWKVDYASFRPQLERTRKLPTRKRNDLLHVDAFPSRPTGGGRILRCFTNIHPQQPRIWRTTEAFEGLARKYASSAGLARIANRNASLMRSWAQTVKQRLGLQPKGQSAYDRFMLQFHDYLKETADFQRHCEKIDLVFPPGSTWICFTDAVPHAVTYGQYALEQTVLVPLAAMLVPQASPLRILERLAGRPLA